ncbi:unnamed protein product [Brassica oleracea]
MTTMGLRKEGKVSRSVSGTTTFDVDTEAVEGTTNRVDALDAALRRSGRFDCEIALGVPDEKMRELRYSLLWSRDLD